MKTIDAHIHFYQGSGYFDQIAVAAGHENSAAHLRERFEALDIVGAVVMGNRNLDFSYHQYPDFLRYCVGLDGSVLHDQSPRDAADMVERHLRRGNCVGVKLYPGYSHIYVSDPMYDPVYELAERYQKPVAVHTGSTATSQALLKYSHPLTLDEAAMRHPRVQFVMCHFGNPWLADAAAVVGKNENVAADLSGLLEGRIDLDAFFRENDGYIQMLRTWLAYLHRYDSILYGTDWPLVNLGEYRAFVARLVPERHHRQVFFDNANRIYRLGL